MKEPEKIPLFTMKCILAYNIGRKIEKESKSSNGEMKAAFSLAYEMLKTEPELVGEIDQFILLDLLLDEDVGIFSDEDFDLYKIISADHYIERVRRELNSLSSGPARLAFRLVIEFVLSEPEVSNEGIDSGDYASDFCEVAVELDRMAEARVGQDLVC